MPPKGLDHNKRSERMEWITEFITQYGLIAMFLLIALSMPVYHYQVKSFLTPFRSSCRYEWETIDASDRY